MYWKSVVLFFATSLFLLSMQVAGAFAGSPQVHASYLVAQVPGTTNNKPSPLPWDGAKPPQTEAGPAAIIILVIFCVTALGATIAVLAWAIKKRSIMERQFADEVVKKTNTSVAEAEKPLWNSYRWAARTWIAFGVLKIATTVLPMPSMSKKPPENWAVIDYVATAWDVASAVGLIGLGIGMWRRSHRALVGGTVLTIVNALLVLLVTMVLLAERAPHLGMLIAFVQSIPIIPALLCWQRYLLVAAAKKAQKSAPEMP